MVHLFNTYRLTHRPPIVTIRFYPVGSAPPLRQKVFKVSASQKFETVVNFLRKKLDCKSTDSVFCYVNSVFAPGLDEGVGGLFRVSPDSSHFLEVFSRREVPVSSQMGTVLYRAQSERGATERKYIEETNETVSIKLIKDDDEDKSVQDRTSTRKGTAFAFDRKPERSWRERTEKRYSALIEYLLILRHKHPVLQS